MFVHIILSLVNVAYKHLGNRFSFGYPYFPFVLPVCLIVISHFGSEV